MQTLHSGRHAEDVKHPTPSAATHANPWLWLARGALLFYASFNIFIGVLNLLPLLPLDGGHIAVATYERVRSRKGRMYHADFAKLLPLTYVVVVLMASLMLFTGLRDIVDPLKF